MTSGWGVDATLNGSGVPTSGTSDSDVRKVWGGLYTTGIISGCDVTTSGSQLKYTVASGVVAIKNADGERIMTPVSGGTVTAPTVTADRTDIVYVQQHFPTIEGDSNVELGVATTLPPRALAIGTFSLNAGATNTNSAVESADRLYSVPYGASLGQLYYWQNQYDGPLSNSMLRQGQGSFTVPTDRMVTFHVSACLSAARPNGTGATGFDASAYCEFGILPSIDGGDICLWSSPGLHQAWQTLSYQVTIPVLAGRHNVNLGLFRIVGPGTALAHYGVDGLGYGRNGIEFTIRDAGPKR